MRICLALFMMLLSLPSWAVDSYRYLHVTIDTPWSIFVFLIPFVFGPLVLMIILYWRHALKRQQTESERKSHQVNENSPGPQPPPDPPPESPPDPS